MKEHKFPDSEMKFDLVYELVIQDILPIHFKLNYNLYKMTFINSREYQILSVEIKRTTPALYLKLF